MDPVGHAGYTRTHACGFCGRPGLAHQNTRPSATLFCDRACAKLYKLHNCLNGPQAPHLRGASF
jgi:hypothetical protein